MVSGFKLLAANSVTVLSWTVSVSFDHVNIDHDDIDHVNIDHVDIDHVAIDHGPD